MLLMLIGVLVFGAVAFLVVALTGRAPSAIESRIQDFRTRVAVLGEDETDLTVPFTERILKPSVETLSRAASSVLPQSLLKDIEKQLSMAGNPMKLNTFVASWAVSLFTMTGCALLGALSIGGSPGPIQLVFIVTFAALGWMLPRMWLKGKVRSRQKTIIKALPDALDLVTTCVEAGLGLDASLARVAEKSAGTLADDLARMLRDVAMGKMRREALTEMSERVGVEELTMFVNSVIQAEQLGVGIAQVLRVQSDQLRMRRRQRAEQAAHQAAIKLMFPLVLFIFPAFMLVILGPAVIRIADALSR